MRSGLAPEPAVSTCFESATANVSRLNSPLRNRETLRKVRAHRLFDKCLCHALCEFETGVLKGRDKALLAVSSLAAEQVWNVIAGEAMVACLHVRRALGLALPHRPHQPCFGACEPDLVFHS